MRVFKGHVPHASCVGAHYVPRPSASYRVIQVVGCLVVVGGTALTIGGEFGHSGTNVVWYSVLVYALADVPIALSSVVKELAFKSTAIDVFFLTTVVSWIQLALVWVLLPLESLKGLGGDPLHEIPGLLRGGFSCFVADGAEVHDADGNVTGTCDWRVPATTFLFS